MIREERLALIQRELRRKAIVSVSDLVRTMGVSTVTVRRDLDELGAEGVVERIRGGARLISPGMERFASPDVIPTAEGLSWPLDGLVLPGQTVGVTGLQHTAAVTNSLMAIPDVTIVTNSLLALEQTRRQDQGQGRRLEAVLIGGVLTDRDILAGPMAAKCLAGLHLDAVLLDCEGLDHEAGLTVRNLLEAEALRAFIAAADRVVVTTDVTTWQRVAFTTVADIEVVDTLIVMGADDAQLTELREFFPEVIAG